MQKNICKIHQRSGENQYLDADLKEISIENISVFLNQKSGYWNELTNRKQWEVTIKYNGSEPTVIIDAYTGEFIDLYGPLN